MSAEVFGVIAPHPPIMLERVGGPRSHVTEASSRAMLRAAQLMAAFDPDTVVIMSPHAPSASGGFVIETASTVSGSLSGFGAPDTGLSFRGDPEFAQALLARLDEEGIPALDRRAVPALESGTLDHGVIVPMSYLDPDARWPLLVVSLSSLDYRSHRAFGTLIADTASRIGRRMAFVASGDCSHRLTHDAPAGYAPRADEFDQLLVKLIGDSRFDELSSIDPALVEVAGECGLRSFITLGAAAQPAHARILEYEGPWGVGYLTAVVNEDLVTADLGGAAGSHESEIVSLARAAIEAYVDRRERLDPAPFDLAGLPERAGVFVSLHRNDELRGCIGTITPTQPDLAHEVVRNAIEAAAADPRFSPMVPAELSDLDVKVDVLHVPEECALEDLDPSLYGVIVTSGHRRGLLLPDLEGVDTTQQQVDIACRKAGIQPQDRIELERFRVDRHS